MSEIIKQELKIIVNSLYGGNSDIETDFINSIHFLCTKLGIKFLTYEFAENIKEKYNIGYNDLYNFGLVQTKVRDYEINNILNKI